MNNTELQTPAPKKRYLSVDIVRGFAMAFVVGGGTLVMDFANLRYCSVLFRIGSSLTLAPIIFYKTTTQRARILWVTGILTVYAVLSLVPVAPDATAAIEDQLTKIEAKLQTPFL